MRLRRAACFRIPDRTDQMIDQVGLHFTLALFLYHRCKGLLSAHFFEVTQY